MALYWPFPALPLPFDLSALIRPLQAIVEGLTVMATDLTACLPLAKLIKFSILL